MGELIHNSHVISELENSGIVTINKLPEKGVGICVIRSHGESNEVFRQIENKGYELVDLTCFDVKKVQSKATELAHDDYYYIFGVFGFCFGVSTNSYYFGMFGFS